MLTCAKCAEVLPDILDGKADPALLSEFLAKTKRHEKCRNCFETYKKSAALTRYAYIDSEPPKLCEQLLTFLKNRLVQ